MYREFLPRLKLLRIRPDKDCVFAAVLLDTGKINARLTLMNGIAQSLVRCGTIATVTIVMCLSTHVVHCANDEVGAGIIDKAEHGFINIATGWIELPMQIGKGYRRGIHINPSTPALSRSLGTVWGTVRGFDFAVGRTYLGFYQLFGCWTANPTNNEGIGVPLDGEYVFDYGLMHAVPLNSVHTLFFNKITRGGRNIAGIIVDWPISIPYITKRDRAPEGIAKGLWFVPSRFVVGVYELSGFILPSALETRGYSFERKPKSATRR